MKEFSATTMSVLDQLRIVIVWLIFLVPWGPFLCRVQDTFHWVEVVLVTVENNHHFLYILQMVGLLFVIFGVWIYNDIIIMPFIRQAMKRSESAQATNRIQNN